VSAFNAGTFCSYTCRLESGLCILQLWTLFKCNLKNWHTPLGTVTKILVFLCLRIQVRSSQYGRDRLTRSNVAMLRCICFFLNFKETRPPFWDHYAKLMYYCFDWMVAVFTSLTVLVLCDGNSGSNGVLTENQLMTAIKSLCSLVNHTNDKVVCSKVFRCLAFQSLPRSIISSQVSLCNLGLEKTEICILNWISGFILDSFSYFLV